MRSICMGAPCRSLFRVLEVSALIGAGKPQGAGKLDCRQITSACYICSTYGQAVGGVRIQTGFQQTHEKIGRRRRLTDSINGRG